MHKGGMMGKQVLKYLKLIFLFIVLIIIIYWLKFGLPPLFSYSDDFYLDKKEQIYNTYLGNGNYRLGFYIGQKNVIGKKNDGDYTLRYYCSNKLAREVKNLKIKRDEEVPYDEPDRHTLIFIDRFNIPKDIGCNKIKVEIITNKNFSLFKELNISNPTTFYINKSEYVAKLEKVWGEETEKYRKKYPDEFKNVPFELYDKNSTKLLVMKALFKKDLHSLKTLFKQYDLDSSIELGESQNYQQTKRTPLIYAAYFNDLATVKYLLKNKADVNHKDFIKKVALQYAIESNATDVVEYLLNSGTKKEYACYVHECENCKSKLTPLAYAIKNEYYKLFKILLEHGFRKIDLDCKGIDNYNEESPLLSSYNKVEGIKSKPKNKNSRWTRDKHFHIYDYLYQMDYPVRFLKLFKKYGLKDKKYENDFTKEWFKKDFEECQTGIYGGRCHYILEHNVTLQQYDIYKFFEIIGHDNRNKKTKRSK